MTPLSRSLALAWGSVVVLALALTPWARLWARDLPACPFHALSGLPCPACGSARALLALAALDPLAALRWNPLAALAATLFGTGGLVAALGELGGRPLREPRSLPPVWRIAVVAALVVNWAYLLWARR